MGKTKNTKTAAAWSLVMMGAGFAATLPFQQFGWARLLAGSFEAGLVGGLADWFAVTALFRHPLGIPIPHTALLPKNRGKLTDALVNTVENNLLHKESIASKIAEIRLAELVLKNVEKGIRTPEAVTFIDVLVKQLVRSLPLAELAPVITTGIKRQATEFDIGPLLEALARQAGERKYDQRALDYALEQTESWLLRSDTGVALGTLGMQAVSGLQVSGLMQFALNAFLGYLNEERMGEMIRHFLLDRVAELQDEGHPRRQAVLEGINTQLIRLAAKDTVREGLNHWKNTFIDSWEGDAAISEKLEELRRYLLDYMEDADYVTTYIVPLLDQMLSDLWRNTQLLDKINSWIVAGVTGVVEANHSQIGNLVRENVNRMDDASLIALMEDKLGQDLQWIRINGALTGFLIGIVLTAVRMLLE
ncbi:DUF445 domain-containing protein [Paenibacillus polymyxa]|uniref:DUF445 domain-containing protein n=1 Tax=Paenibacillus TaxID=44249 RepID=UPI0004D768E6|nr:DUF445 domain-containing protein [Paenibacillus polymyxa]KEO79609.1 membrane protein [Paenibacillus polymyxa]MCF2717007.1 DUF445 domain-containing protein [Paenibacillus sp. UKAQ_18]MCH6188584.1 DUF445 domain-containing protein [Paenibacillus polymyxa]WRL61469.1 DUF445 domain-containing protein [Paenibacillus polymyxa]